MSFLTFAVDWLKSPQQWSGPNGIPVRVLEHLGYTVASLLLAAANALPIGLSSAISIAAALPLSIRLMSGGPSPPSAC
jgi:hypothetical protein